MQLKSYKEFILAEGLVKVPTKFKDDVTTIIYSRIVAYLEKYTLYNVPNKVYPTFRQMIGKLKSKFKVNPKIKSPQFKKTSTNKIQWSEDDLPTNYTNLKYDKKPKKFNIRVNFANTHENSYAYFDWAKNNITINVGKELKKVENTNNIDAWLALFTFLLKGLPLTIEHEIMHHTQFNILRGVDKSQFDTKLDVKLDDNGNNLTATEKYYLSVVERKPQILSAINRYINTFVYAKTNEYKLKVLKNKIIKNDPYFKVLYKYNRKNFNFRGCQI